MNIQETKYGSVHRISLSGDLTILNITKLRERLFAAFNEEDNVVVSVDSASNVDFTFFQLMCSACRSFTAVGKSFCIDTKSELPLTLKTLCLGFARHTTCTHEECSNCLWTTKEKI
jgi:ABC-type transporter Mla MlaB component